MTRPPPCTWCTASAARSAAPRPHCPRSPAASDPPYLRGERPMNCKGMHCQGCGPGGGAAGGAGAVIALVVIVVLALRKAWPAIVSAVEIAAWTVAGLAGTAIAVTGAVLTLPVLR